MGDAIAFIGIGNIASAVVDGLVTAPGVALDRACVTDH